MMTRTVEYELAKLLRDEKDIVVGREVLLPPSGEPFQRMQEGSSGHVREEIMRKHHDLIKDIPCQDVQVNFRPFVQS